MNISYEAVIKIPTKITPLSLVSIYIIHILNEKPNKKVKPELSDTPFKSETGLGMNSFMRG